MKITDPDQTSKIMVPQIASYPSGFRSESLKDDSALSALQRNLYGRIYASANKKLSRQFKAT